MFRTRHLALVLVTALAIVATACEGDSASIEATSSTATSSTAPATTAAPPTTTTTTTTRPPTTTTTKPPTTTTTTTVPLFDLAAFSFDSLVLWAEAGSIDVEFRRYAISSCERAVDSTAKIAQVLQQELVLTLGSLIEVKDGNLTLGEAAARFETLKDVWPFAMGFALAISETPAVGGATDYAALVHDTLNSALFYLILFPISVYDVELGTIDWEAFEVFGPGLITAIEELQNLGQRSWAAYC